MEDLYDSATKRYLRFKPLINALESKALTIPGCSYKPLEQDYHTLSEAHEKFQSYLKEKIELLAVDCKVVELLNFD